MGIERRCGKRLALEVNYGSIRNRHLAEWRFLLFTLTVTVQNRTWKVNVIGMTITPFRVVWLTAAVLCSACWYNITKKDRKQALPV